MLEMMVFLLKTTDFVRTNDGFYTKNDEIHRCGLADSSGPVHDPKGALLHRK